MAVKKRVIVLLCITALTLITIDVRGGDTGPIGAVRSTVRGAFSPVQKTINAIASPISSWTDGVMHASELKAENKKLKREITKIDTENKTYIAAVGENERLHDLLELNEKIGAQTTTARVVTGSPNNFETTLQIDRGSNSGVKVGDPVVEGAGLVGRIIEVSRTRSTVLLITDSTSGVGVRDARTGVVGIAQGQAGQENLSVEFVDPDANIKRGDTLVTSGLQDGRYPANIPVGTVSRVRRNASGLTKDVILKPLVNIDEISIVSVLHTGGK